MNALKKEQYLVLAAAIMMFCSRGYSQGNAGLPVDPDDPSGAIEAQVTAAVQAQFGPEYSVGIQVLDSTIAQSRGTSEGSELADPYGTLHHCVLFGADRKSERDWEHGIMGLYRDGQIIWHSDPVFKGVFGGTFAIKDINRDSRVDILVEWYPATQIMVRNLWIISWDGNKGSLINQVDPEDSNSTLISESEMFQLIEPDTLAPAVIRGYWSDDETLSGYFPTAQVPTRPWVTYSWNGSLYGLWPDTRQIPGTEFLPANRLAVSVACRVEGVNDSLSFQYTWRNAPESRQRMTFFALEGVQRSFLTIEPEHWRLFGWWQDRPIAAWEVEGPSRFTWGLRPGTTQQGITIHAHAIPAVITFYAQGYAPEPDFDVDNMDFKSSYENNFYHNSYSGKTIGPVDPPDSMTAGSIDLLIAAVKEAQSLGWLADQGFANELINGLENARKHLARGDTTNCIKELNVFQRKVQDQYAESGQKGTPAYGRYLSPEGYGLLYFTTRQFVDRLSQAR